MARAKKKMTAPRFLHRLTIDGEVVLHLNLRGVFGFARMRK
jgi:hypothetical protein